MDNDALAQGDTRSDDKKVHDTMLKTSVQKQEHDQDVDLPPVHNLSKGKEACRLEANVDDFCKNYDPNIDQTCVEQASDGDRISETQSDDDDGMLAGKPVLLQPNVPGEQLHDVVANTSGQVPICSYNQPRQDKTRKDELPASTKKTRKVEPHEQVHLHFEQNHPCSFSTQGPLYPRCIGSETSSPGKLTGQQDKDHGKTKFFASHIKESGSASRDKNARLLKRRTEEHSTQEQIMRRLKLDTSKGWTDAYSKRAKRGQP